MAETKDPTPPFTESVPNPPTGVEAQERVERNLEAAVDRGDDKAAEGYAQQSADPTTPFPGAANEGRGADNEPTPKEEAEGKGPKANQADASDQASGRPQSVNTTPSP